MGTVASNSENSATARGRWPRGLAAGSLIVTLVPLLLAAVTFGVLIHTLTLNREADDEVQRGLRVLGQIHAAHAALAEAASGVRGFIITGDTAFLQPYERAEGKLREALQQLEQDIRDPEQRGRLTEISELVDIKLRNLAVLAARAPALEEAQILGDARDNKALLDRLRSRIAAMEEREHRVIAGLRAEQERVRRITQASSLFAVLLTFAFASLLSRWFAGSLIRRIRHLRDNARRIGQREPLQPWPGNQRDELAELDARLVQTGDLLEHQLRELEAARQTAERASQAKTRFLSRTSHELRTPLNAIVGFSRLLRERADDPQQTRHVTVIQHSAEHLLQLVNDLLDLSRVEAGQITLVREPVDLGAQVRRALDIVDGRARARRIHLQSDLPDGLPAALGDASRVLQVLLNLLDNAVKFSPECTTVTVSASLRAPGQIAVRVRDQGPGIPAAFRAELFRPFSRQDGQAEGVGLGLAISHGLAHAMQGELHCLPTDGRGSCFELLLEVASQAALPPVTEASIGPPVGSSKDDTGPRARVCLRTRDEAFAVQIEATAKRLGLGLQRSLPSASGPDAGSWIVIRDEQEPSPAEALPVDAIRAIFVRGERVAAANEQLILPGAPVSAWRLALQEVADERPRTRGA